MSPRLPGSGALLELHALDIIESPFLLNGPTVRGLDPVQRFWVYRRPDRSLIG
ncbi:unnamed protein product [Ectocarpus sp. CCAP 1310/34]|nr:unnamed protein product [Ectocarpus sp. CCAP 1310/34]